MTCVMIRGNGQWNARPTNFKVLGGTMKLTQSYLKSVVHYDPVTGNVSRLGKGNILQRTHSDGYLECRIGAISILHHRLAFLYMTGDIPKRIVHINGDRKDNKWANLTPFVKTGKRKEILTAQKLRDLVVYDPDTGLFARKHDENHRRKAGDIVGTMSATGYWVYTITNTQYKLHRLAYMYMTGEMPPAQIDHINGNRADNRWANLRAATQAENGTNQKRSVRNKSGVSGVSWDNQFRKWHAQIRHNGKRVHLGRYDNFLFAVGVRKQAEQGYGYHPNHGRVTNKTIAGSK